MTHAVVMSKTQSKSYKKLAEAAQSIDVQTLALFIERAEGIQNDLAELIRAMDRVRMDKLAAGKPEPQDFLAMKGKVANEKE